MTAIEDARPDYASITFDGKTETFRRGEVGYELLMQVADARREIERLIAEHERLAAENEVTKQEHAWIQRTLVATTPPTDDEREALVGEALAIARHERIAETRDGDARHVKIAEVLEDLAAGFRQGPITDTYTKGTS